MIEYFDVSLTHERHGQIRREVEANRLEKRLRQGRVRRASLLSGLLGSLGYGAGSRTERRPAHVSNT